MGGGDLNMKKSWHPLLMKNQERVWLEEKKALEEKKKLDQLRKEKEEERQLQELQRLQEEKTGRKRTERLDWMYATPATGSNVNPNDLEDYLLGKKRVDKLLIGNENEKIGAAHKDFIAVQNANTARDIASKIREDPLLAMKQQEQAALQAILSNPLRLKEMQSKAGGSSKDKDKKHKKDKKERSKKDKHRHRSNRYDDDDRRDRRRSRSRSVGRERHRSDRYDSPQRRRSPYDERDSRSRSPELRRRSRSRSPRTPRTRDDDDRRAYHARQRLESPRVDKERNRSSRFHGSDETSSEERRRSMSPEAQRFSDVRDRKRDRSLTPPAYNKRSRLPPARSQPDMRSANRSAPSQNSGGNGYNASAEERAARLAAMSADASSLTVERKERLSNLLAHEKAEMEAEEQARAKSGGIGSFLNAEQKKVFSGQGGLEDRIRRGRSGLVALGD